jgi:hypothetical protein
VIETISIKEAGTILKYKDARSVIKWCASNDVPIHNSGQKKYVIKMQFELARLKSFIQSLKEQFGENWLDAFQKYTSMNIFQVIQLEEKENRLLKREHYKPMGREEIKFLNKIGKLSI